MHTFYASNIKSIGWVALLKLKDDFLTFNFILALKKVEKI
jgi:hypothetical protein